MHNSTTKHFLFHKKHPNPSTDHYKPINQGKSESVTFGWLWPLNRTTSISSLKHYKQNATLTLSWQACSHLFWVFVLLAFALPFSSCQKRRPSGWGRNGREESSRRRSLLIMNNHRRIPVSEKETLVPFSF